MLLREETIKGEHNRTLGLSSGSSGYQAFRSINKPQTLYFCCLGASHGEEHNQNGMCDLFIHMHVPRPLWGTLS